MGNNVVIPSYGNWYVDLLRKMKIKVKSAYESSTFFITLDCEDESHNPLIVKAYQYTQPLEPLPIVKFSYEYFQHMNENKQQSDALCAFDDIQLFNDKCVFMVRKKYEYTLSQRLSDYPLPEDIEKRWITHQFLLAVQAFHNIHLIHGNIHPENVFLSWDMRMAIGDPAPYKPAQIGFNQPHIFIHFFGSSNTHCYLSPRRLFFQGSDFDNNSSDFIKNQKVINAFNELDESDDIFSCGCVIYFIFTQKHLFSLTTIGEYVKGNFDLDKALEEIPEDIRELVKKCVSLDANERREIFSRFNTFFPSYFTQILHQIEELFQNDNQLSHLIPMIPIFEEFAKIGGNDAKIILSNILALFLLQSNNLQAKVTFSHFFIEFTSTLPDEILLTRVFPNIVGLLTPDSTLMTKTVFDCLETLFQNINSIPPHFALIFQNYLVPVIIFLIDKSNQNTNLRLCICEFLPKLIQITTRLDPSSSQSCIKAMSFILKENDEMILNCFLHSIRGLIKEATLPFNSIFTLFLSCLNSPNIKFRSRILPLFQEYYVVLPIKDKVEYRTIAYSLLIATLSLLGHGSVEAQEALLKFIDWLYSIKAIDSSCLPDIYNFLISHLNSSHDVIRFFVKRISKKLPEEFLYMNLPDFILKSLNKRDQSIPNLCNKDLTNKTPSINGDSWLDSSKFFITPKFMKSIRIGTSGITTISGLSDSMNNCIILLSDRSGKVYRTSNSSFHVDKITEMEGGVSSMLSLNNSKSVLLASGNKLSTYNLMTQSFSPIPYETNSPIKTINKFISEDCFYCMTNNSEVYFYDKRMKEPINYINFHNLKALSTCVWSRSQIIAYGFEEGEVILYDPRIFLPFKSYQTKPALCITPLCDHHGAFFVGGNAGSEVFNIFKSEPIVVSEFKANFASSYKGTALFTTDDSTVLLSVNPMFRAFILNDGRTYKLEFSLKKKAQNILQEGYSPYPPLHCHSAPMTSLFKIHNEFFSGDLNGFLNIWTVENENK